MMLPNVEVLGQGHGLIQVQEAWNHIQAHADDKSLDVNIAVSVLSDRFDRGIYLRQLSEVRKADTFKVQVLPVFHEDTLPDVKVQFEMRVVLRSSEAWVTAPEKVLLATVGKTISVLVDPRQLPVGLHVAFVRGYDESAPEKGAIFEVPVVVIRPEEVQTADRTYTFGSLDLQPGERVRRFIVPPAGCTFVDAVLKDTRNDVEGSAGVVVTSEDGGPGVVSGLGLDGSGRQVVIHALQLFRGTPYRDNEKEVRSQVSCAVLH